jgi:hypothetical protein
MFTHGQYRVNEVWIAIKINIAFIFVMDEPYDIYVLLDAASEYIFGNVLSRADGVPPEKDVANLFKKAWETKHQWAEKLILTEKSMATDVFRTQAEINGISVNIGSSSDLEPIIGTLKKSFTSNFIGNIAKDIN